MPQRHNPAPARSPPAHRPPTRSRRRPGVAWHRPAPRSPQRPSRYSRYRAIPGRAGAWGLAGLSCSFALGFRSSRGRHGSGSAVRTVPGARHARGAGGGDRTLSALAVYGNAIFGAAGELREFGITAFIWLMLFSS